MSIALSPPQRGTYQPAPVKKRRAASFVIAGVAGVAGIALAATFTYFTQPGDASYAGDTTADVVSYNELHLGQLAWSGVDYAGDDGSSSAEPVATPDSAVHSTIELTNENIQDRQVVRLINVVPDGNDDLYNDIWVRIDRRNPYGDTRPDEFRYFGPLSELSNLYMGNMVQGATHTFDVWAWTASAHPSDVGPYDTSFKVNYSVYASEFEDASEDAFESIEP